ncbi:MAG: hypothetical protein HUJ58_06030 [Erysipelotrichaceae bacterium]|nr:hypothetical protein [Erysipelotrichaceae bacterium]
MVDVPVYVFTGFLESGKTQLLKQTILDEEFNDGARTLILCCEEGIEEYDKKTLKKANADIVYVQSFDELTERNMVAWDNAYKPDQVMIEYNGTWSVTEFLNLSFPLDWLIVQLVATVDGSTFANYMNNMRSLMYEQLVHAELIIINRIDASLKKSFLRGNVKAINKSAQIVYEDIYGNVNSMIDDDLPFDKTTNELTISDDDYGLWFMDTTDHPFEYEGKTVHFKGRMYNTTQWEKPVVVIGRQAMVCCEQDTSLIGFVCEGIRKGVVTEEGMWANITATVKVRRNEEQKLDYVVMNNVTVQPCEGLENEYVTFS